MQTVAIVIEKSMSNLKMVNATLTKKDQNKPLKNNNSLNKTLKYKIHFQNQLNMILNAALSQSQDLNFDLQSASSMYTQYRMQVRRLLSRTKSTQSHPNVLLLS